MRAARRAPNYHILSRRRRRERKSKCDSRLVFQPLAGRADSQTVSVAQIQAKRGASEPASRPASQFGCRPSRAGRPFISRSAATRRARARKSADSNIRHCRRGPIGGRRPAGEMIELGPICFAASASACSQCKRRLGEPASGRPKETPSGTSLGGRSWTTSSSRSSRSAALIWRLSCCARVCCNFRRRDLATSPARAELSESDAPAPCFISPPAPSALN